MLSDAALALSEIFSPPFRGVMWKSLGFTLVALVLVWLGIEGAVTWLVDLEAYPWLETVIGLATGIGLVIGLGFLVAPVASLFAGLFADEIAAVVEKTHYPLDPPGTAQPVLTAFLAALRFTALVIVVNILLLLLLLLPGINLIAFFIGNGYLLGREYFEAAAARFRSVEEARALRRAQSVPVFMAGLVIAVFLAIPILNLFTPIFATALMVHVHKRLTGAVRG